MPTHPDRRRPARGVRLNNPGNIRRSKDPWRGLAAEQRPGLLHLRGAGMGHPRHGPHPDGYQDDYGLDTVRKIIGRWAPPSENNVDAYVSSVAQRVGSQAGPAHRRAELRLPRPLVVAMIRHECANYTYPQAVIDKGLALAGVVPDDHTVVIRSPSPGQPGHGRSRGHRRRDQCPHRRRQGVADSASGLSDSLGPLLGGYAPAVCVVVLLAAIAVLCWRSAAAGAGGRMTSLLAALLALAGLAGGLWRCWPVRAAQAARRAVPRPSGRRTGPRSTRCSGGTRQRQRAPDGRCGGEAVEDHSA